ncbi:transcription factor TFIIH complex subunit Tfb5-domain-containing protein [Aspergillus carlsbadensis]|nr:transcription factor TFIIH complex subunit Tfb5-domain-containing protein [Aspergillus carlsbadensis]
MPRAVRGAISPTPTTAIPNESKRSQTNTICFIPGVLIECDPSVKAIILKYDEERHDYIVEDLDDDRHLVIKESQLQNLKIRLGRELDDKVMQPEESESE